MLHRVRPHLVTLLLALLMAGQSLLVQYLSGIDIQGLVLMDIAAALLLAMLCGRRLLRVICLLQGILSFCIINYALTMGMPPTMTATLGGAKHLGGMDMKGMLAYVHFWPSLGVAALMLASWLLSAYKPAYTRGRWLALLCGIVLFAGQALAFGPQPLNHFSLNSPEDRLRMRDFESPARRSLKYRGYLATFLLEVSTGSAWSVRHLIPLPCSADGIDAIPLPTPGKRILLCQVECLDAELLNMQVNGEYVMPFLHSLLPDAILVHLAGTKKLTSANSDFEILNGLDALSDVSHYEYLQNYPDNLVRCLQQRGFRVEAFSGVTQTYMNRLYAYRQHGFDRFTALEDMLQEGITPIPGWYKGVISDNDLFAQAARNAGDGPQCTLVITMNMHLPQCIEHIVKNRHFVDGNNAVFFDLARSTDQALRNYMESTPDGTMLILWGDHSSYAGNNSGKIPFLVYTKGQQHHFDGRHLPGLTRCKMYHYLRRLLGCESAAAACLR